MRYVAQKGQEHTLLTRRQYATTVVNTNNDPCVSVKTVTWTQTIILNSNTKFLNDSK